MASTYTKKEVDELIDTYTKNPCLEVVNALSVTLNKPRKSIISKLSKEGVYVTRGYTNKMGATPITKLQVVREIESALDTKLPDLDKAPKPTLLKLSTALKEITQLLEDSLQELKEASEVNRVLSEIEELRR
jgi:hypothetical protein